MKKILLFLLITTTSAQSEFNKMFQEKSIPKSVIITDKNNLLKLSKNTLLYLCKRKAQEDTRINSVLFNNKHRYLKETRNSLRNLILKLEKSSNKPMDESFINQNFITVKWEGHKPSANKNKVNMESGNIRLTKYLAFKVEGSNKQTPKYCHALFAVPKDEAELTDQQIEKKKQSLIRFKYDKQDIVKGVLESPKNRPFMTPLVWLDREGLEEAIMQGTIIVKTPETKEHIFNVHKSNEIPYNKKLKNKLLQKRYWYFKEVDGFQGYGKDFNSRIKVIPEVTFAGDVSQLGVGTIVAISYTNTVTNKKETRLGIIADYGGAFTNNLYQLDYFMGAFPSRQAFKEKIKPIPDSVEAYILLNK